MLASVAIAQSIKLHTVEEGGNILLDFLYATFKRAVCDPGYADAIL
jgi:hypothetical protein